MTTKNFTWVFGLTADPIHRGHEQVVKNTLNIAESLGLSTHQFMFVPTYQPHLIADKTAPAADFKDRFAMCRLVAHELSQELNSQVTVSDIEQKIHSDQPSYTYDTLDALSKQHDNLILIMSSDHAHGHAPKFRQWHRWEELISRFGLMIHERPGYPLNDCFVSYLKELNPDVYVAKNQPSIDISSSRIRNAYGYGAEVTEEFISPKVAEYIENQNLYR